MSKKPNNILKESSEPYIANVSDDERLRRDVFRSDMDKLKLFTKMLRTNNLLNKAKINHKQSMDVSDETLIQFWKSLNDHNVKYIMVGGFATRFHEQQAIDEIRQCFLYMQLLVFNINIANYMFLHIMTFQLRRLYSIQYNIKEPL